MSSTTQAITQKNSSAYEVSDFISLAPSKDYVLVRKYRTAHSDSGHIVNEEAVASPEELLEKMIRAFEGRCLHQPDGLRGVFRDPQHAQQCAEAVSVHHGKTAEVLGKDLFIPI